MPAMGRATKSWIASVLLAVCGLWFASAWAITLEEAARKVAKDHDARVLSARTIVRDGQRVHEIKVVTKDGVVKTVRVPENS